MVLVDHWINITDQCNRKSSPQSLCLGSDPLFSGETAVSLLGTVAYKGLPSGLMALEREEAVIKLVARCQH